MPNFNKRRASEAQDLEESYRLADIVKQRHKTLDVLKLKTGELVLDIGCGVGFLTHEMALQVG
ncbi:MAG: class I SAM-dependent methyltransferase, partial [SAR324 cluster bacterium]|nr:class I SAM-dependent methyltransferase [SAR324 cluster bacterium]